MSRVIVVPKNSKHPEHLESKNKLFRYLEKSNIPFETLSIDDIQGSYSFYEAKSQRKSLNADIVITLGGDGTLLSVSHYVGGDTQLIGINSTPSRSIGFLCAASPSSMEDMLSQVFSGKKLFDLVQRLQVTLKKQKNPVKTIPLALNDILFCNVHPAATSRYWFTSALQSQNLSFPHSAFLEHISSGVWISAAAGSTAAIASYGLPHLSLGSTQFQTAVREPVRVGRHVFSLLPPEERKDIEYCKTHSQQEEIYIVSSMDRALLCIDGTSAEVGIAADDEFTIKLSPDAALKLIRPKN